uniref:Ig-like domain-containing protein n=1 Tax=Amphilophus citrinellus TaxID=61819 RepID=A0A3Q0QQD4_AMPCI
LSVEPPSFVKIPQPVEGLKGKDVVLYCEMCGTAPYQITWFKDRKPLMESRKYKMVREGSSVSRKCQMKIKNIRFSNDCHFADFPFCAVFLLSSEPPSFVKRLSNMTVILGGEVTLVVKVCGTPELIPKWFKDGVELASGRKYKISFSRMISSLNVLSAEKIDSGEYTFEVMNEVGKDLSKINLTVLGIVFIHITGKLKGCMRLDAKVVFHFY